MWRNFICGELLNVKKFKMYRLKYNMIHTVLPWRGMAVLLQNLHSSNLRCFVATPILSRFTHLLCGEKLGPKFCLWRKNDKYDV